MDESTRFQIAKLLEREKALMGETNTIVGPNQTGIPGDQNPIRMQVKSEMSTEIDSSRSQSLSKTRCRVARLGSSPKRYEDAENIAPQAAANVNFESESLLDSYSLENSEVQLAVKRRELELLNSQNINIKPQESDTTKRHGKRSLIDSVQPTGGHRISANRRSRISVRRPLKRMSSMIFQGRPMLSVSEVQSMLSSVRIKKQRANHVLTSSRSQREVKQRPYTAKSSTIHSFSQDNYGLYAKDDSRDIFGSPNVSNSIAESFSQCMELIVNADSPLLQEDIQTFIRTMRQSLLGIGVLQLRVFRASSIISSNTSFYDVEEAEAIGKFSLSDLHSALRIQPEMKICRSYILGNSTFAILDGLDPRLYPLSQIFRLDHNLLLPAGAEHFGPEHVLCLVVDERKESSSFFAVAVCTVLTENFLPVSDDENIHHSTSQDDASFDLSAVQEIHDGEKGKKNMETSVFFVKWILHSMLLLLQRNENVSSMSTDYNQIQQRLVHEELTNASTAAIDELTQMLSLTYKSMESKHLPNLDKSNRIAVMKLISERGQDVHQLKRVLLKCILRLVDAILYKQFSNSISIITTKIISEDGVWDIEILTNDDRRIEERLYPSAIQTMLLELQTRLQVKSATIAQYTYVQMESLSAETLLWCSRIFNSSSFLSNMQDDKSSWYLVCSALPPFNDAATDTLNLILFPIHKSQAAILGISHEMKSASSNVCDIFALHIKRIMCELVSTFDAYSRTRQLSVDVQCQEVQNKLFDMFQSSSYGMQNSKNQLLDIIRIFENDRFTESMSVRGSQLILCDEFGSGNVPSGFLVPSTLSNNVSFSSLPRPNAEYSWMNELQSGRFVAVNCFRLLDGHPNSSDLALKEFLTRLASFCHRGGDFYKNVLLVPIIVPSSENAEDKKLNILALFDCFDMQCLDDHELKQIIDNDNDGSSIFSFYEPRVDSLKRSLRRLCGLWSEKLSHILHLCEKERYFDRCFAAHRYQVSLLSNQRNRQIMGGAFQRWRTVLLQNRLVCQSDASTQAFSLLETYLNTSNERETIQSISKSLDSIIGNHANSRQKTSYHEVFSRYGHAAINNIKNRLQRHYDELQCKTIKTSTLFSSFFELNQANDARHVEFCLKDYFQFSGEQYIRYSANLSFAEIALARTELHCPSIFESAMLAKYCNKGLVTSMALNSNLVWKLYISSSPYPLIIVSVTLRQDEKISDEDDIPAVIFEILGDDIVVTDGSAVLAKIINFLDGTDKDSSGSIVLLTILRKLVELLRLQRKTRSADIQFNSLSSELVQLKKGVMISQQKHFSTMELLDNFIDCSKLGLHILGVVQNSNYLSSTPVPNSYFSEIFYALAELVWGRFSSVFNLTKKSNEDAELSSSGKLLLLVNTQLFDSEDMISSGEYKESHLKLIWPKSDLSVTGMEFPWANASTISPFMTVEQLKYLQTQERAILLENGEFCYGALLILTDRKHEMVKEEPRVLSIQMLSQLCCNVLQMLHSRHLLQVAQLHLSAVSQNNQLLEEELLLRRSSEQQLESRLFESTQTLTQSLETERNLRVKADEELEIVMSTAEKSWEREIEKERERVRLLADFIQSLCKDYFLQTASTEAFSESKQVLDVVRHFLQDMDTSSTDMSMISKVSAISRPLVPLIKWLNERTRLYRSRLSIVTVASLERALKTSVTTTSFEDHHARSVLEHLFPISNLAMLVPELHDKIYDACYHNQTLLMECDISGFCLSVKPVEEGDSFHDGNHLVHPQLLIIPNRRIQNLLDGKGQISSHENSDDTVAAYIFVKDEGFNIFSSTDLVMLDAICNIASLFASLPISVHLFAKPIPLLEDSRDKEISVLHSKLADSVPLDQFNLVRNDLEKQRSSAEIEAQNMLGWMHRLWTESPFCRPAVSTVQLLRMVNLFGSRLFGDVSLNADVSTYLIVSTTSFHKERQFLLKCIYSLSNIDISDHDYHDETFGQLAAIQQKLGISSALELALSQPHKRTVVHDSRLLVLPIFGCRSNETEVNSSDSSFSSVLVILHVQNKPNGVDIANTNEFIWRTNLMQLAAKLLMERFVSTVSAVSAMNQATQAISVLSDARENLQSRCVAEMTNCSTYEKMVRCQLEMFQEILSTTEKSSEPCRTEWAVSDDIQRLRRDVQNVIGESDDVLIFVDPYFGNESQSNVRDLLDCIFPADLLSNKFLEQCAERNLCKNSNADKLICITDSGLPRFVSIPALSAEQFCINNSNLALRITVSESNLLEVNQDQIISHNEVISNDINVSSSTIRSWSLDLAHSSLSENLQQSNTDFKYQPNSCAIVVPLKLSIPFIQSDSADCKWSYLKGSIVILKRGARGFNSQDTLRVHQLCSSYQASQLTVSLTKILRKTSKSFHVLQNQVDNQNQIIASLQEHLLDTKGVLSMIETQMHSCGKNLFQVASPIGPCIDTALRINKLLGFLSEKETHVPPSPQNIFDESKSILQYHLKSVMPSSVKIQELTKGTFEKSISQMVDNAQRVNILELLNKNNANGNQRISNSRMIIAALPNNNGFDKSSVSNASGVTLEVLPSDVSFLSAACLTGQAIWLIIVSQREMSVLTSSSISDATTGISYISLQEVLLLLVSPSPETFVLHISENDTTGKASMIGSLYLSMLLANVSIYWQHSMNNLSHRVVDERVKYVELRSKFRDKELKWLDEMKSLQDQHAQLRQAEEIEKALLGKRRTEKKRFLRVSYTSSAQLLNDVSRCQLNDTPEIFGNYCRIFNSLYDAAFEGVSASNVSCVDNDGFSILPLRHISDVWEVDASSLNLNGNVAITNLVTYMGSQLLSQNSGNASISPSMVIMADDVTLNRVQLVLQEMSYDTTGTNSLCFCSPALFMASRSGNVELPSEMLVLCVFNSNFQKALLISLPSLHRINRNAIPFLQRSMQVTRCILQNALNILSLQRICEFNVKSHQHFCHARSRLLLTCLELYHNKQNMLRSLKLVGFKNFQLNTTISRLEAISQDSTTNSDIVRRQQRWLDAAQQQLADHAELQAMSLTVSLMQNQSQDKIETFDISTRLESVWARCSLTLCSLLASQVSVRSLSLVLNPHFANWVVGNRDSGHEGMLFFANDEFPPFSSNAISSGGHMHNNIEEWHASGVSSPLKRKMNRTPVDNADSASSFLPFVDMTLSHASVQRKPIFDLDKRTRQLISALFTENVNSHSEDRPVQRVYRVQTTSSNSDTSATAIEGDSGSNIELVVVVRQSSLDTVCGIIRIQLHSQDEAGVQAAESIALRFSSALLPLLRDAVRQSHTEANLKHVSRALELQVSNQRYFSSQLHDSQDMIRKIQRDCSNLVKFIGSSYIGNSSNQDCVSIGDSSAREEITSKLRSEVTALCLNVSCALDCAVTVVLEAIRSPLLRTADGYAHVDSVPFVHHTGATTDSISHKFPFSLILPFRNYSEEQTLVAVGELGLRFASAEDRDSLQQSQVTQKFLMSLVYSRLNQIILWIINESSQHTAINHLQNQRDLAVDTTKQLEALIWNRSALLRQSIEITKRLKLRYGQSRHWWYRQLSLYRELILRLSTLNVLSTQEVRKQSMTLPLPLSTFHSATKLQTQSPVLEALSLSAKSLRKIFLEFLDEAESIHETPIDKPLLAVILSATSEVVETDLESPNAHILELPLLQVFAVSPIWTTGSLEETLRLLTAQACEQVAAKSIRLRRNETHDIFLIAIPILKETAQNNSSQLDEFLLEDLDEQAYERVLQELMIVAGRFDERSLHDDQRLLTVQQDRLNISIDTAVSSFENSMQKLLSIEASRHSSDAGSKPISVLSFAFVLPSAAIKDILPTLGDGTQMELDGQVELLCRATTMVSHFSELCKNTIPSILNSTLTQLALENNIQAYYRVTTQQQQCHIEDAHLANQKLIEIRKQLSICSRNHELQAEIFFWLLNSSFGRVSRYFRARWKEVVRLFLTDLEGTSLGDSMNKLEDELLPSVLLDEKSFFQILCSPNELISVTLDKIRVCALMHFESETAAKEKADTVRSSLSHIRDNLKCIITCILPTGNIISPHWLVLIYAYGSGDDESFTEISVDESTTNWLQKCVGTFYEMIVSLQQQVNKSLVRLMHAQTKAQKLLSEAMLEHVNAKLSEGFETALRDCKKEIMRLSHDVCERDKSMADIQHHLTSADEHRAHISTAAENLCLAYEYLLSFSEKLILRNTQMRKQLQEFRLSAKLNSSKFLRAQESFTSQMHLLRMLMNGTNMQSALVDKVGETLSFAISSGAITAENDENESKQRMSTLRKNRLKWEAAYLQNLSSILLLQVFIRLQFEKSSSLDDVVILSESDSDETDSDENVADQFSAERRGSALVQMRRILQPANLSTAINSEFSSTNQVDDTNDANHHPQLQLKQKGTSLPRKINKLDSATKHNVKQSESTVANDFWDVTVSLLKPIQITDQRPKSGEYAVDLDILTYSVSNISLKDIDFRENVNEETQSRSVLESIQKMMANSSAKEKIVCHSSLPLIPHHRLRQSGYDSSKANRLPSTLERQVSYLLEHNPTKHPQTLNAEDTTLKTKFIAAKPNSEGEDLTSEILYSNVNNSIEFENVRAKVSHFAFHRPIDTDPIESKSVPQKPWERVQVNDLISLPSFLTNKLLSLQNGRDKTVAEAHLWLVPVPFYPDGMEQPGDTGVGMNENGILLRVLLLRNNKGSDTLPLILSDRNLEESLFYQARRNYLQCYFQYFYPMFQHAQNLIIFQRFRREQQAVRQKLGHIIGEKDYNMLRVHSLFEKFSEHLVRCMVRFEKVHPASLSPYEALQQRSQSALRLCLRILRCSAAALVIPDDHEGGSSFPESFKVMRVGSKRALSYPSSFGSSTFFTIANPSHSPSVASHSWKHSLTVNCLRSGKQICVPNATADKRYLPSLDGIVSNESTLLLIPVMDSTSERNRAEDNNSSVRAVLVFVRDGDMIKKLLSKHKPSIEEPKLSSAQSCDLKNLNLNSVVIGDQGFHKEELIVAALLGGLFALELFWCGGLNSIHSQLHRTNTQLKKLEQTLIGKRDESNIV